MVRILVINTLYSPNIGGGAEIICQEQAEALAARGHHVAVLTTGEKGSGLVGDNVNGLTVYRAGIKNVYWHYGRPNGRIKHLLWHLCDVYNVGMGSYVDRVIEKEKPEVMLCHNMSGFSVSAWTVAKRHDMPVVEVLHDQYLRCPNSNAFKNARPCVSQCGVCRLLRIPHKRMSGKVDAVIGVSGFVLRSLTDMGYFSHSRLYVIHNARRFYVQPRCVRWTNDEPLRIGYIGTLSEVKGVEWLIRTFIGLDINATLTIAGRGATPEYEEHLKDIASADKRITFSGYTTPATHYPNIDLSVVPSLWPDTFPTVAFESCAYGVPVIATNRGGLPEIIHDGVNGLVCDADDNRSLGKAILRLASSPSMLAALSDACPQAVQEMTDCESWIDRVENVIYEVIGK